MLENSFSPKVYRYEISGVYILLDNEDHIFIYRRIDKWYHKLLRRYYFSTAPNANLYRFKKQSILKVYRGTEFEYLINHFTRIAKVTSLEDKHMYQFSICRFLSGSMSNAQYYRITLGLDDFGSKVGSS